MRKYVRRSSVGAALGAILVALLLAIFGLTLPPGAAQAQIFQSNSIEYRYGTAFKEPGTANGDDIEKNILNFTHVDGYKYGSNFFSVDLLMSAGNDPANNGSQGAQEVYMVYRHDLSFNKVSNSKDFAWGPIADMGFHAGGDANSKNTAFGPEKRLIVAGPYIAWAVPTGFLTTSFNFCKEWNHNGIVGDAVSFDPTFCFESAWSFPFKIAGASLHFNGFFNVVAPKGKDGFGNETKTEVLTRPELMLDVGEFWGKKDLIDVGFAYEYWLNKFGNDHNTVVGSLANTPMAVARVHF
jgi:hypothetical protein